MSAPSIITLNEDPTLVAPSSEFEFDRETWRLSTYTQGSVADALRLEYFFLSVPSWGQFHSRRERPHHVVLLTS